jgi:hypothetical protein
MDWFTDDDRGIMQNWYKTKPLEEAVRDIIRKIKDKGSTHF